MIDEEHVQPRAYPPTDPTSDAALLASIDLQDGIVSPPEAVEGPALMEAAPASDAPPAPSAPPAPAE